jgi:uncharacterized membrane protein YkoI
MIFRVILPSMLLLMIVPAERSEAQGVVRQSDGSISRSHARGDAARLFARLPGLSSDLRARIRVSGDSAQRIALSDFEWKGRVNSVEIDEEDTRLYWDVKIVPDSIARTIVRYRVDAVTGGILSIREFTGIAGLSAKRQ